MPGTQTLIRTLVVVLALPLVWFFAPLQLHGHTGYAILSGISMEPRYHDGDLILIRERPSYHAGEVVAYHSRTYGVVLHRVKRINPNGTFIFRGDNNTFDDPAVAVQDVIGARWLRVPKVGAAMVWVRKPWHELLLIAIALMLGGASSLTARRRSPGAAAVAAGAAPPPRRTRRVPASNALLLAAIGFALCAGSWAVAQASPLTRSAVDNRLFQQSGRLTVTGHAPESTVYPGGTVHTGEAIFTRLVRSLTLGFDYGVSADRPLTPRGSVALELELAADNGWTKTLTLARVPLQGPHAHVAAKLDVAQLERTARNVDAQTGVPARSFTATVVGRVDLAGHAGATPIKGSFSPRVTYSLEPDRLLVQPGPDGKAPFSATKPGSGVVSVPNAFHLGVADVSVTRARSLAAWGALVALLAAVAALLLLRTHDDEPTRLAWRYRDWLVPITQLPRTTSTVTDVSEFDSLVQLAERHNKSILHLADAGEHTYLVKENGLLYRYTAVDAGTARSAVRAAAPGSTS